MKKQIGLLFTLHLFCLSLFGQKSSGTSWQITPSSQFLIAGEANSTYDFLVGGSIYYFRPLSKRTQAFLGGSFHTKLPGPGSSLLLFELQPGIRFDLSPRKENKGFFVDGKLGLLYWDEQLAIDLSDREVLHHISTFGLSGQVNIGYQFSKNINLQLQTKQFFNKGTSIGLGLSLSL